MSCAPACQGLRFLTREAGELSDGTEDAVYELYYTSIPALRSVQLMLSVFPHWLQVTYQQRTVSVLFLK